MPLFVFMEEYMLRRNWIWFIFLLAWSLLFSILATFGTYWPIRPADEIYNAKLQKRLSFDSVVSCVKRFE
jgi:hypothetical protein